METITSFIADKPVVIFSKTSCCMSHTVKLLIESFGANPTVYEVDEIPNGKDVEAALQQLGCEPCVPAVFIGQNLIGGASEIMSLNVKNELGPLLVDAKAIWLWK